MAKYEIETPKFVTPIFGDERMNTIRCIDCKYFAGSDRTPQWLFASDRGFCDSPTRKGGPWNVLQGVSRLRPNCKGYERATQDKIDLRVKAIEIFKARQKHQEETYR